MVKVSVSKSAIPIIFLDTWFYIDLARKDSQYYNKERELADLVAKLVREKKMLCPICDQDEEYELGKWYEKDIRREQLRLSLGLKSNDHHSMYLWQLQLALRAYIANADSIEVDEKCLFDTNPSEVVERSIDQGLMMSVSIQMPEEVLATRRKNQTELAVEFEDIRVGDVNKGVSFQTALKAEKLATSNTIDKVVRELLALKCGYTSAMPTDELENGQMVLAEHYAYFRIIAGDDTSIKGLINFLESEYYTSMPFIDVQSKIYAEIMTNKQRKVKQSDKIDVQHVSQMLPFSSFLLVDGPMMTRLISKPLMLDKDYDCRIFSLKNIEELIGMIKYN